MAVVKLSRQRAPAPCKMVLLASGKGGVGRSTLTRGLLVASSLRGIEASALDCDPQQTVAKWSSRRDAAREALPEFSSTTVTCAKLSEWRDICAARRPERVVLVDTPPTIETHLPGMMGLAAHASLTLVPTSAAPDDLDSVIPWMRTLREHRARAVFVLNKANPRTRSFQRARSQLLAAGPLAPVEIPLAEDIASHHEHGLTVLDIRRSRGLEAFKDLWTFVAREIGL